jgi:hypothetical protein
LNTACTYLVRSEHSCISLEGVVASVRHCLASSMLGSCETPARYVNTNLPVLTDTVYRSNSIVSYFRIVSPIQVLFSITKIQSVDNVGVPVYTFSYNGTGGHYGTYTSLQMNLHVLIHYKHLCSKQCFGPRTEWILITFAPRSGSASESRSGCGYLKIIAKS